MTFKPNPELSDFQWKDYSGVNFPERAEKELQQLQKAYAYLEEIFSETKSELAQIKKDIGPILRCGCDSFFIEVDSCDTCHQPKCSDCILVVKHNPIKLECMPCFDQR